MRKSWDTSIKHLARHDVLEHVLSKAQIKAIPSSNLYRWKKESDNKYHYSEINEVVKQEIELIKKLNQSTKVKTILKSYFNLCRTFHLILGRIKPIKTELRRNMTLIVNSIDAVAGIISVDDALNVFNISRTTYQNYKSIVIHKCEASYFKLCTIRFNNQLLASEVDVITQYMQDRSYKYWSKSSIYLRALRDNALHFGLSTFYKYCRLLGFSNTSTIKRFPYKPLVTQRPNQVWCADVTIFRTEDGKKHYIHILMDHYSKKIIGYKVDEFSSGKAIATLLKEAFTLYKPNNTMFLTDAGTENINTTVSSLLDSYNSTITHRIAQRDVVFSNSMIEAFNKVLKYQFLFPEGLKNRLELNKILAKAIIVYNTERPQMALRGSTPNEVFSGKAIRLSDYKPAFKVQRKTRMQKHKKSACQKCRNKA